MTRWKTSTPPRETGAKVVEAELDTARIVLAEERFYEGFAAVKFPRAVFALNSNSTIVRFYFTRPVRDLTRCLHQRRAINRPIDTILCEPQAPSSSSIKDGERFGSEDTLDQANQTLNAYAREAADAAARELSEPAMATAFELSALYKRRAKKKGDESTAEGGTETAPTGG